jgi:multidrug efflux pump subunit AcrB
MIDVQASDTAEIEVILDPTRLAAGQLTVVDVADALKAQNTLLPVGRFQEGGLQHLTLATGLWKNTEQIAAAGQMKDGARLRA